MNRVHVANFRSTNHAVDFQVTLVTAGTTDAVGFISQFQVGRTTIRFAEYRYRLDSHFTASANNTKCNFTAVGDQNTVIHEQIYFR